MECLSYRIDWDGNSLVITGDTGRHSDVEKLARDATALVVNVWDHQDDMSSTLLSGFCGTLDAAEMAAAAGVKRLVITHQGPQYFPTRLQGKSCGRYGGDFQGRANIRRGVLDP